MPFKVRLIDAAYTSLAPKVLGALKILRPEAGRRRAACFSAGLTYYTRLRNERMVIWLRGSRGRTPLVKLSNSDSRFLVEMLELRRATILRQPEQSPKARAVELQRLDAILTQIKAELPQATDPEIVEAIKLVRSL